MDNSKKVAAAVSAVLQYIKTEEEAVYLQSLAAASREAEQVSAGVAAAPLKLWGISGRQTQMQMRDQVQAKSVYGWKKR